MSTNIKLYLLVIAVATVGCGGTNVPSYPEPYSSPTSPYSPVEAEATVLAMPPQTAFDIVESCSLRSGPSETSPPKVNEKATRMLGETHYQNVDSSVTVEVLQRENGWVEVRVLQPVHLRETHRGWIPESAINSGPATSKRDGWIRSRCTVYAAADDSSLVVGYLDPPSSVGVADDGTGWLRLMHGPVRNGSAGEFVENPNFEGGLYIESDAFTTSLPGNW